MRSDRITAVSRYLTAQSLQSSGSRSASNRWGDGWSDGVPDEQRELQARAAAKRHDLRDSTLMRPTPTRSIVTPLIHAGGHASAARLAHSGSLPAQAHADTVRQAPSLPDR